ncbi:MAG: hypothetical protein GC191_06955 [Azospirillum sp.]|nr:hypothetical protein [Azospirillum sp.]
MIALEHFHPIVVHFPIVLLLQAAILESVVVVRGGDLDGPQILPTAARVSLYLGAFAALAAVGFGYLAQGIAIDKGFADALIEEHEMLGVVTAALFAVVAGARFLLWQRGVVLARGRAAAVTALTVAGLAVLLSTAYHGGMLVYDHGVNVAQVKP